MANAYFGDHPGRLEIPGECSNLLCLTRTPRLSRDIIVSKYNEKQKCGATETSKTVASANVPCLSPESCKETLELFPEVDEEENMDIFLDERTNSMSRREIEYMDNEAYVNDPDSWNDPWEDMTTRNF